MYSANIYDRLTESFYHTPFVATEQEAKRMAELKIERLEKIKNAIGNNRFEIESYTIK